MQVYFKMGDDLMENTRTIKRNLLIFIVFISVIGFVGYFIDRMTGHADYTNAGMGDTGTAGMGIWLISTMEDAYINPLLLSGAVVIHAQTALVFSLSAGVLSMFMYLGIGFWLRNIRRKIENQETQR